MITKSYPSIYFNRLVLNVGSRKRFPFKNQVVVYVLKNTHLETADLNEYFSIHSWKVLLYS